MANKDNQSKEYRIYIKESKSWVDVNKEFYTNYYRDINAYRKRQQEHGRCVCPASKRTKKNPQRKSTEPSPLSWDLTVRSAVEIIQTLLSMMTEEFYSYKNGALVFTQKAPLLFII